MSAILGLLSDRKLGSLDFQGLYAGNNSQDYYLQRFARFDKNGEAGISWHWPALFITLYWLLYRKMWLYAFIYFIAPYIVGGVLGVMAAASEGSGLVKMLTFFVYLAYFVVPPLYANAWYYRHCHKKIEAAEASSNDTQRQLGELTAVGGTSGVAIFLIGGVVLVALIGIVAAIAIPAYNDYAARARVNEVVNYGNAATEAVARYYQVQHQMPVALDQTDLNLPLPEWTHNPFIEARTGSITFSFRGNAPLKDKTLVFLPSLDANQQFTWRCLSPELPDKYLPAQCRKGR
jgi:Tfp pilus assembly protein PilE